MMFKKALLPLSLVVLAVGCQSQAGGGSAKGEPSGDGASSSASVPEGAGKGFAPVAAILNQNCVGCHGEKRAPGGIHFTSYEGVIAGGEEGPVVKPGDPANSVIIRALRGQPGVRKMPPRNTSLSEEQIKTIEAWIKAGAKA